MCVRGQKSNIPPTPICTLPHHLRHTVSIFKCLFSGRVWHIPLLCVKSHIIRTNLRRVQPVISWFACYQPHDFCFRGIKSKQSKNNLRYGRKSCQAVKNTSHDASRSKQRDLHLTICQYHTNKQNWEPCHFPSFALASPSTLASLASPEFLMSRALPVGWIWGDQKIKSDISRVRSKESGRV